MSGANPTSWDILSLLSCTSEGSVLRHTPTHMAHSKKLLSPCLVSFFSLWRPVSSPHVPQ